ncbi:hypothetical protein [Winogradskyella sp. 3972H.M.0a.05]|uniref:hypothetical protein n=1 Tax=Winogradskyella sp. 3972H.M.0a.05 TaxID=2950277 RepID=UPI003397C7F3
MKLKYILFIIYIVVFPFYFFERGNPQIADAFGALLVLFHFKSIVNSLGAHRFFKSLLLFVVYTIIVNCAWMIILDEILLLKSSLYYIYSFMIILVFYSKMKDEGFLRTIAYALLMSLCLQFVLWPFIPNQGVRTMMFFKDPNQLSFWSFSMLIISYLVYKLAEIKGILLYAVLLLSTFFIFISASKSGVAVAIIFWLYFFTKTKRQIMILSMVSVIGFSIFLFTGKLDSKNFTFADNAIERLSEKKRGQGNTLNDRGYDRILNYPQYTILGAGEGKYKRFGYRIELHSTFFNILFSYGVLGLFLFGTAITIILKNSNWTIKLILLLIVLYTLAHMTLRSPFFWLSLLLLFYLNYTNNNTIKAE